MFRLVVAALIVRNNRILITQRKKNDESALKWEFPGGTVMRRENIYAAMRREIREELEVDVGIRYVYDIQRMVKKDILIIFILCSLRHGRPKASDCND